MKLLLLLKPLITAVKEIAYKQGLIADYVVERSDINPFFYAKWKSGECELRGNIKQTTDSVKTTLPFAVTNSTVQLTFAEHTGVTYRPVAKVSGELINSTTLQTCVDVVPSTNHYQIAVEIKGRWKSGGGTN